MGAKHGTPRERFERFVSPEPTSGCHLWTGCLDHSGYGWLRVDGKSIKAHRWVFEELHGPVPPGMFVCHKCDVRACVNPRHLFAGSPLENAADMVAKGRSAFGVKLNHAKMTDESVYAMRALYAAGRSIRSLARQFGITHEPARAIVHGRTWKHLLTGGRHRVHE